jgi:3D (Asp-Asp-Asp) domain-containing protein
MPRLPHPRSLRTRAMRRASLAVAVLVVGVLAMAVGWMAAGPLTSHPAPTAAPVAPTTTASSASSAASPSPTPTPTRAPAGRMWSVVVTFYGAADNDPPGSTEIAHPNGRHQEAGGSGTYADPLSLAADPRAIPVGTRVYYPPLRKYFVMEDDCAQCITDWRSSRTPHIDLWTGNYQGAALIACENALTPDALVAVELNPPPSRPVDPTPLYTGRGCTA